MSFGAGLGSALFLDYRLRFRLTWLLTGAYWSGMFLLSTGVALCWLLPHTRLVYSSLLYRHSCIAGTVRNRVREILVGGHNGIVKYTYPEREPQKCGEYG